MTPNTLVAISRLRRVAAAAVTSACLSGCGPLGAAPPPPRVLYEFDSNDPADAWLIRGRGLCAVVPGPPHAPPATGGPRGGALRVAGGRGMATGLPVRGAEWQGYSALRLWVYRDPDEAKRRPRTVIELWLREPDGYAGFWRRVDVAHHGWAPVDLPLRWFRPTQNRLPDWAKVSQLEVRLREETDLLIDRVVLHRDDAGRGVEPTLSDWRDVGFPGVPDRQVRRAETDAVRLLTNAPGLDTDLLARHLAAVRDRVRRDLGERPRQPPVLLVFATRQQYQAFPIHLADRLDADAGLPQSDGYTIRGVATSYWDPVQGTTRPVYTHEYVHSLLEQAVGLGNTGEWLQEGLATHYQHEFHPQGGFARVVEQGFSTHGERHPLRRLTDGSQVGVRRYWQAATLVGLLLEDPAYRRLIPMLLAAFREASSTALDPHLAPILGCTWDDLEQKWLQYCSRKYRFTPDPRAAESPDAIRRLAAGARVHVVGVDTPAGQGGIGVQDVRDWASLTAGLAADTPLAVRLRDRLWLPRPALLGDRASLRRLSTPPANASEGRDHHLVVLGLSRLIGDPDLYAAEAFGGVAPGAEAARLIEKGRDRTPLDIRRLNRLLLSAAFPTSLPPPPPESDYARVRVQGSAPVLLFLTSSQPCRWQVTVVPGTPVRAVVLSGGGWQDVVGVDAPVIQLSRVGRDGRDFSADWFHASRADSQEYMRVERFVGELTGGHPFQFHGREKAGPDPIVITGE